MIGRNGIDDLCRLVMVVTFFALVVAIFFWPLVFDTLALMLLIYSMFRMLSKNIAARQRENQSYLALKQRVTGRFKNTRNYWATRKQYKSTHKFFTCKNCHHHLRVPKGKGTVVVTCPNCHEKFEAHT